MKDQFVRLVTGSSRGQERAIAEGILDRGDIVVATARKVGDLESLRDKYVDRLLLLTLDMTIYEQAQAGVRAL
jgi:NAD(P)-dependent dehydrogenase (short-subunit alcohol dehydrogenase family)